MFCPLLLMKSNMDYFYLFIYFLSKLEKETIQTKQSVFVPNGGYARDVTTAEAAAVTSH